VIALGTCAIFTALTGATGLTIIALGGILLPAMSRGKYPESFSLGLLTTSGTLGLLFPPSLPLIVYAIVAKVDIGQLFVAALLPGALLVVLLSVYSILVAARLRVPRKTFRAGELVAAVGGCIWELPLPVVVLGGIYTGYFAVSEAAAITAMYVFVVEVLILRDIRWGVLPELIKQSMVLVGGVLIILGAAMGLTNYLIDAEIPMQMLDFFREHVASRTLFLAVLNLFLLAVGCTMGIFSALVVVVPLIAPIAKAYGIDPIHLGIIFLTNLEIGASIPPLGINLFIAGLRFDRPVLTLYAACLPFGDKSFDFVISINTIHNLPLEECKRALQEIQRVSRKDAFISVDADGRPACYHREEHHCDTSHVGHSGHDAILPESGGLVAATTRRRGWHNGRE